MTRRHIRRGETGWPAELEHLREVPPGLWLDGTGTLAGGGVAVVGARRATVAGLEIARSIGAHVGELGVTVVSGFARGIDAAAHGGALDAGGQTIAVLGCGIDVVYPPEHLELAARVRASGLLVSEEEPGEEPRPGNFPKRNRIIAALASVVVVVEAAERSGALSTARWAADLGRELLAVPGSIRAEQHRGTNLLIRDGVRPYLGPADLAEVLSMLPLEGSPPSRGPALPEALRTFLDCLGGDPVHPDAVAALLGLGPAETASRISALELAGEVRSLPGGLILRSHRAPSVGLE